VTEITSDWRTFHFPRDSRVITCVNLNLADNMQAGRLCSSSSRKQMFILQLIILKTPAQ